MIEQLPPFEVTIRRDDMYLHAFLARKGSAGLLIASWRHCSDHIDHRALHDWMRMLDAHCARMNERTEGLPR